MSLIIGSIIGLVMGLTGAGGALVAIPLFMHFQSMTLKEASVLSLVAVVVASVSNFYYQRKNAQIKLAIVFILASTFGSFLSQPYKSFLPDMGIAILLTVVALYSLIGVWRPKKVANYSQKAPSIFLTMALGIFLGVLTTFTGLGGGVLMLPVLLSVYGLPQAQAVATSLLVVGFSSLSSFLIQLQDGLKISFRAELWGLIVSIFVVSFLLKVVLQRLPVKIIELARKSVFSLVVIIALAKIF